MNKDSALINGETPLRGKIVIQGSKNAALPLLASTILFKKEVVIQNVPNLIDIRSMLDILGFLGARFLFSNGVVRIDCSDVENKTIPLHLTEKLRASSLLIGPLLARFGEIQIGMPGGCSIGPRPLNYHLEALTSLGYLVTHDEQFIYAKKNQESQDVIALRYPSVGATENILMASLFEKKEISVKNIAREPEILDLMHFLQQAGARMKMTDIATVSIGCSKELQTTEYRAQSDRIEAGTFLIAGLASKGSVTVVDIEPENLAFVLFKLMEMGAKISYENRTITASYDESMVGTTIKTAIYPGFPTDLQPQMSALLTQVQTPSILIENIFDNRLNHLLEMQKMDAKIKISGKMAFIKPSVLHGTRVDSFDLRGSAAMMIAGLSAKGATRVTGLHHLFRGYESFVEKLQYLGADLCYL